MIRVIILGAAGSIGQNTINACRQNTKTHKIIAISYFKNHTKVVKIAQKLNIPYIIGPENCKKSINGIKSFTSYRVALEVLKPDIVVNGIKGFAGLEYTLTTIQQNVDLALANKESLIVGYPLIQKILQNSTSQIIPVDSEHFSIYTASKGKFKNISKIWLTASGGHFYDGQKLNFNIPNVRAKALSHPTWEMGAEITVNSATLMNKAFEIIEAVNLFNLTYEQVGILWHHESLIHGIVTLNNGITTMIGFPHDMAIPINAALNISNVNNYKCEQLNINAIGSWNFSPICKEKLIAFQIAKIAVQSQQNSIVMVTANEFYVKLFIDGVIQLKDLLPKVKRIMDEFLMWPKQPLTTYWQIIAFYKVVDEFCKSDHLKWSKGM